ncbi:MAG: glycosyl transferase involved in lipopolysaccharide synthesis [Candidatus Angelobacter sp.]|jgi:lipopolysaccharide/colanic/teichoic acid biosynthesis glycosyltransferase|nr:glycosyl transferase involved in lipopolysaccharide synthesis [Candidatus Angelobacter sp.]
MLDFSSVAERRTEPAIGFGQTISPWCNSKSKRAFDIVTASALLFAALPVMLFAALLVRFTSRGPILFSHTRLGKSGDQISVLKFRTMVDRKSIQGPEVTQCGDSRVTPVGRYLRKWKIDELPQLFNVLCGEMSMVGPRPDLAKYLQQVPREYLRILLVRPGITSPATIAFRNEEQMLSGIPADAVEAFYCSELLPQKIHIDLEYAEHAGLLSDLKMLLRTAAIVVCSSKADVFAPTQNPEKVMQS